LLEPHIEIRNLLDGFCWNSLDCSLPSDWQGREFFILDCIQLAHSTQIRATAAYGGVRISVPTEKEYKHWETNQQPQYLSKFSHGKIPAWEGKDGFLLFESVAIMRYSASP
jgi:hypothetical protein